ncbi:homoserine dehydrogenase [cf. Phormidesmis sp. LEGE 11477]|uniref:homoserine dehydrogenase n=1 Tax=cf. Phormidesmis sp. LEGE 11477 TaxID=1828680 RepID=UPI00187E061D|nr:homoserine dehydrogenase [cf. Phormidesmis sp. LEGE 11477]MBE9059400.1 homoserine dehydrogenase [cf. Phormidesmis sp. LEGE 11477]
MNSKAVLKVGILGLGTVGTGVAKILLETKGRHALLNRLQIERVGVRSLKPRSVDLPNTLYTTDLDSIVTDPNIDIIVEVIGGLEPARSLILKAIENGKHIVSANKAVISRYGEEIYAAANAKSVYVMIEAAVGGGIPVIAPLKQALSVNRIQAVMGIINGTTNYILTRMQNEGGDFAAILTDAQALGYAEADPTADVDGLDAADKISILAALAFGGRIRREDIYCEGIRNVSAADISYAEKLGFVIKLLAIAKLPEQIPKENKINSLPSQIQARVHPTLVPINHPLASVNGVNNAVLIEGEPIGQIMLYGPGAGEGPTASAVVADLIAIAANPSRQNDPNPLLTCSHTYSLDIVPSAEVVTRLYVRLLVKDTPGVIGKLGTCFGQYDVSLESIVQIGIQNGLVELVVVTHEVSEGSFQQALDEIRQFPEVTDIPSLLHVL